MLQFLIPDYYYLKKLHGYELWLKNQINEKKDFLKIDVQGNVSEISYDLFDYLINLMDINLNSRY